MCHEKMNFDGLQTSIGRSMNKDEGGGFFSFSCADVLKIVSFVLQKTMTKNYSFTIIFHLSFNL